MNPKKMLKMYTILMMSAAALSVTISYWQAPSSFSQQELTPIQGPGTLAPAFSFIDHIPLLRRSGNHNELDLLKPLAIVVGLTLLVYVKPERRATMAMFATCVICSVVITYPVLSEIASGRRPQKVQMQTNSP